MKTSCVIQVNQCTVYLQLLFAFWTSLELLFGRELIEQDSSSLIVIEGFDDGNIRLLPWTIGQFVVSGVALGVREMNPGVGGTSSPPCILSTFRWNDLDALETSSSIASRSVSSWNLALQQSTRLNAVLNSLFMYAYMAGLIALKRVIHLVSDRLFVSILASKPIDVAKPCYTRSPFIAYIALKTIRRYDVHDKEWQPIKVK